MAWIIADPKTKEILELSNKRPDFTEEELILAFSSARNLSSKEFTVKQLSHKETRLIFDSRPYSLLWLDGRIVSVFVYSYLQCLFDRKLFDRKLVAETASTEKVPFELVSYQSYSKQ